MKEINDLVKEYPELKEGNYKEIPISEVLASLGYKIKHNINADNKWADIDAYKRLEILAIGEEAEGDAPAPVVPAAPAVKKVVPPIAPVVKKPIAPIAKPKIEKSDVSYDIRIDKTIKKGEDKENSTVSLSTDKPISEEVLKNLLTKIESAEKEGDKELSEIIKEAYEKYIANPLDRKAKMELLELTKELDEVDNGVSASEENDIESFKKDILEVAKEYYIDAGFGDEWNEETMKQKIEEDIKATEETMGKKILKVNLAGSIDSGVYMADVLFEGDKEYTPVNIWLNETELDMTMHVEDGDIEGSKKVKSFAEAYHILQEDKPNDPKYWDIYKTEKGYSVYRQGVSGSEGFAGDFNASEMEKMFTQGWMDMVKTEEIAASAKSKYKKIMQDKSEEELKEELEALKELRIDSELETETIKDKIKVLDKMLNKPAEEVKKEEKEMKEEVKEKKTEGIVPKGEGVEPKDEEDELGLEEDSKKVKKNIKEDKKNRLKKLEEEEPTADDLIAKKILSSGENVKEELIKLGMKEDEFDTHETDLYVKKTPISEEYLKGYEFKNNVKEFPSDKEPKGEIWYDFPFALMASSKIEAADKPEISKKEGEQYFGIREYFDTDKKAEARIKALEKKGYNVVHYTRITTIEGTERNFYWEIEAIAPKEELNDSVKIEQKIEELPVLKEPKVKAPDKVKPTAVEASAVASVDSETKIAELTEKMNNLFANYYEQEDASKEGKVIKANIQGELEELQKQIQGLSVNPVKVTANEKIEADTPMNTIMKKDMNQRTTTDDGGNNKQQMIQPQVDEAPKNVPTDQKVAVDTKQGDVLDLTQGVKLPEGFVVHKDEKTNELYVMDKNGQEQGIRVPQSAVKDDIPSIIELFTSILGLKPEVAVDTAITDGLPTTTPETSPGVAEQPTLEKISEKLDKLLNVENIATTAEGETTGEEISEDEKKQNKELATIKKDIEQKGQQIKKITNSLIDDNKIIVSIEDIRKFVIKGESAIHARKKAREAKLKALQAKLWSMDSDTIKVIEDAFINKSKNIQASDKNKMGDFLMFLDN